MYIAGYCLHFSFKEALYRIWCGVNRLGDSGVNRLGDNSAFVNPAGQLLLRPSATLKTLFLICMVFYLLFSRVY